MMETREREGHGTRLKYDLVFNTDEVCGALREECGRFQQELVINSGDDVHYRADGLYTGQSLITSVTTSPLPNVAFIKHNDITSPVVNKHSITETPQITPPLNHISAHTSEGTSRSPPGDRAKITIPETSAREQPGVVAQREPPASLFVGERHDTDEWGTTVTPDKVLDQSALRLGQVRFLSRALSEAGEPLFSSLDDLSSSSVSSGEGSLSEVTTYTMRDIRRFSMPLVNTGGRSGASSDVPLEGKTKSTNGDESGVTLKSITPLSTNVPASSSKSNSPKGCSVYYGREPRYAGGKSADSSHINGHSHRHENGRMEARHGHTNGIPHTQNGQPVTPAPATGAGAAGQLSPGGGTFHIHNGWTSLAPNDTEQVSGGRNFDNDLRIVSSRGTVRGVKHRVKAGIASFIERYEGKPIKKYDELEEGQIVVYTTSMQVVRATHERCTRVRHILHTHMARYEERDVFMSRQHQRDLAERISSRGQPEPDAGGTLTVQLPQIYVDGRLMGGAEELDKLNESGQLRVLLKNYKHTIKPSSCDLCGGYRFLPCTSCHGSKKSLHRNHFTAEFSALKCVMCDENGLIPCSACSDHNVH